MLLTIYTILHVIISLIGIGSGLIMIGGWLAGKRCDGVATLFLWTTIATSATGFFFPFHGFKPSYVVGLLSLIILGLTMLARYRYQLAGGWRLTYVISAVTALYLNVFVLIVQLFLKVPALHALAPIQTESPFKMTQLSVLGFFIFAGIFGAKKFR